MSQTEWRADEAALVDKDDLGLRWLWNPWEFRNLSRHKATWSLVIQRAIGTQLLETDATPTEQNIQDLRTVIEELLIFPFAAQAENELQVVFVSGSGRVRPAAPSLPAVNLGVRNFINSLADSPAETEPDELQNRALQYVASSRERSPWADALGPVYSIAGIAAALRMPPSSVREATRTNALFAIPTVEGDLVFPAAQLRADGRVVLGLPWVLAQLGVDVIDRYTLAAWLNMPHEALKKETVWARLRATEELPDDVERLVLQRRARLLL